MKSVGGILLLLAALLFSFGYASYEKRKIIEEESLCRFLSLVQNEFLLYSSPLPKIAEKADEPILENCGYLQALRKSESAKTAFLQTKDNFSMSEKMLCVFSEFSEHFGREDAEEEKKHLSVWTTQAETMLAADKEASKSRIRLAKTLSFSLALGILLLFL